MSAQADVQKTIAFVLYPGLTPLDLVGPLQVMSTLALIDPSFRTTVVAERIEQMPSDTPLGVAAERVFDDEPDPSPWSYPEGVHLRSGRWRTTRSSTTCGRRRNQPRS